MKILEQRCAGALGKLSLACFGDDPSRLAEFVDTVEPGVDKSRKWVLMISTQIGCPVGCRMCDAGTLGYGGNLTASEMLAQVRAVFAANPGLDPARHPKLKVHFARMGEPSLNIAVLEALRLLAAEVPGPGLLPSLSTVAPKSPAVQPFFEELLKIKDELFSGGRFQLQFSVHSTDPDVRRRIVPIRSWSLTELASFGARWVRPGDRKVTLNFAPGPGEELDAVEVARFFDPAAFLIKVTPINPTRAADAAGATFAWDRAPEALERSVGQLRGAGFDVIVSPSLPEEIAAETSCGQLWSSVLKDRASTVLRSRAKIADSYVTAGTLDAKANLWIAGLAHGRERLQVLEPERSALLVVDLQRFFLDPSSPAFQAPARAILGGARRLVDAFRSARRPVIFLSHAHEDPERDGGLMARWWRQVCRAGEPGARVHAALGAREGEVLTKCRYSGFSTPELEARLREGGISQLVVCGAMTNLCVESTVRAAFDLGFKTFVCADATAAHTEALHTASLASLSQGFSKILLVGDVEAAFAPLTKPGACPTLIL